MKVAQSCPTLCDPMDCSLPGSSVHRILQTRIQTRILEWVAIHFSRRSSQSIKSKSPALQADSLPSEPPGKPYSIVVCIYQSQSHILYLPPFFPTWQPEVCFLHLWLHFCFVNRSICTIFLDSTYKQYVWLTHLICWSLCPSMLLKMSSFHYF